MVVFLLIPLSCIAHVAFGLFFGNHRQWPTAELFVILAATIVLFRMLLAGRPLRAWLLSLNIGALLIATGFVWWTQFYSSYPKMNPVLDMGDEIIGFASLADSAHLANEGALDFVAPSPGTEEGDLKITLGATDEEEVFLDASGESFQLGRSPPTLERSPAKRTVKENPSPIHNTSTATLLVFFRGWW